MSQLLIRGSSGAQVHKLRAELARQLGHDAQDFSQLALGDVLDAEAEAAARRWQSGVGLIADGVVGPRCQCALGLRKAGDMVHVVQILSLIHISEPTRPY